MENKIKQGNVKRIGAYTITAIKENYRILPNLFAIENSENTKAIIDAENRKRFRKGLEQRYDEEKERIVEKLEKEYSKDTLIKLKEQATRQIKKQQGTNFPFLSLLSQKLYKNRLLELSGFPSREDWVKKRT